MNILEMLKPNKKKLLIVIIVTLIVSYLYFDWVSNWPRMCQEMIGGQCYPTDQTILTYTYIVTGIALGFFYSVYSLNEYLIKRTS